MEETSLERQQPLEGSETQPRASAPEHPDFEELLRQHRDYQSAFDRKVDRALQTARANWEREQASALEQRRAEALETARGEAQAEYRQRMAELDQRAAQQALRERQVETADRLASLGLSPKFAPWLTGDTSEESQQRVEAFDQLFRGAVSDTVTQRMAGFVPAEPVPAPAFDRETIRGMSPREINAHWAEIQNTLKG